MERKLGFNIVELIDGKKDNTRLVIDRDGKAMWFESAKEAQGHIIHNLHYWHRGKKFQVRPETPIDPTAWLKREADRLENGDYTPVPWHKAKWVNDDKAPKNHFVHVSKDEPSKIAYTESEEKGHRDIQTRMKPSKYLQTYFAHLAESTIRKWVAEYKKLYGDQYELKFAWTKEEIIRIYRDGPSSCMKGVNRVGAYAAGDLAVGYAIRKEKQINGDKPKERIVARTVTWPEKKLYCELIYGDSDILSELLRDEGYKASHHFKGAKLLREELPSVEMARNGIDCTSDKNFYIIR